MSLKTWKEEFYPVEAEDAASNPIEATKHSIQKWKGAMAESLEKHGG